MSPNNYLNVFYKNRIVGTMAMTENKMAAFEYSDEWIKDGFSISPFTLPLEKRVFVPQKPYFHGLFGVFADSLPDAWGNLLLDRLLKKNGIDPDELSVLDRLAIVGDSGMGALTYRPEIQLVQSNAGFDLDEVARQCKQMLTSVYDENLDALYGLGGTSGGARPKIMTEINGEDWIIKFPAHVDGADAGEMEYDYGKCAKRCKIHMTETKLFPSKECKGYFGTQRFDRIRKSEVSSDKERIHMCTVAALLEVDFNQPSLDYTELMKLVKILTRDDPKEVEEMFRRMCFNVFAHNRDDHAKNFTYLYDEEKGKWYLSPAYDITYSSTYYGEHTTSVNGNGSDPGEKELKQVGIKAGISNKMCENIIQEIQTCVESDLREYLI